MIQSDRLDISREKRLKYLSFFVLIISIFLIFRLFQQQVIASGKYREMAEKQYYTKIDQPAKRGDIYIKDNDSLNLVDQKKSGIFPVASDLELFNLTIVPRHIADKRDAAKKLSLLIGEKEEDVYNKIDCDQWYIPPLKKRLTKEEADKIAALDIKGIYLEGQYSRFYPEQEFLSQVLGFVDYDGNGKYGIEEYYDGLLKGEGGLTKGVKDNLGRIIKVEESQPGKSGANIVLSIDRSIQYIVEKKLQEGIEKYGAESGTIIIMDPATGGILAMASLPDFDPNKFNEIKSEEQSVFLNPATSENWEPGSILKPVIVASALDANLLEPDSKPSPEEGGFSNMVTVDGYEIHNSTDTAMGFETVTQILENSDNIGMVWVANKAGNEIMGNFLNKIGFGSKTGIDLSAEASGQLRSSKSWRDVNRATISFGQGISATPIQIIQSYAAIANKGKFIKPHLLDKIVYKNGEEKPFDIGEGEQVMSEDTASKTTDMLVSVVVNGHGKKAAVEGYDVAGKTGTAQIPKAGGGYEENDHIGSFAGFAPAKNPKFVMLVKLDKPKSVEWAESSAAPIFGEIADWLLNSYLKVPKNE